MQNLARNMEYFQPGLTYGQVVHEEDDLYHIRTSTGLVRATQAAGCLVQPMAGDRVLLVADEDGEAYVLSVLKRSEEKPAPTRIVFDGQVDMVVRHGGFCLAAENDMSLASGRKMDLASERLSVHAGSAEAVVEQLSLAARLFRGQVKRIKLVAGNVENTFHRLTQRLNDAFRFVKDHDEVQAGSARYLVEDTLTMNAKNAVHMAEEVVTINADQVHLG